MRPINIYNLTRISKQANIKRLEKQMSRRDGFLSIKAWEIKGIKRLSEHLTSMWDEGSCLEFFYSFQIPKIGKEFDLLRISEDYIVNIELKSGDVTDEKICKQLLLNRYYLAALGKNIRSYTYISEEDRLVRLSNGERLIDATFEELSEDLARQGECYKGDIEPLFREENYLISPLSDPQRFLRREYSLTSQQWDIRSKILANILKNKDEQASFQGFTGLPGTGKTLLLYDIAMQLSRRDNVCVLHMGSFPEELKELDRRLKRIEFLDCRNIDKIPSLDMFEAVFVDEGHRIEKEQFEELVQIANRRKLPVVISYDSEDAICPSERRWDLPSLIKGVPGFITYKLTNRIRMNVELSSFINSVMNCVKFHHRSSYPSVSLAYAADEETARKILSNYMQEGYVFISNGELKNVSRKAGMEIHANAATCREFENVVMVIDSNYSYNEEGYLVSKYREEGQYLVRHLFHGMNRAKYKLSVVVLENEDVFEELLNIVQGKG